MEEERIEVVKTWLKPKSLKDIKDFIGFANFYYCFIKKFSKIIISLILLSRKVDATTSKVWDTENTYDIKTRNIKKLLNLKNQIYKS